MKKHILLIFVSLFEINANAQSIDRAQLQYEQADSMFKVKEYEKAIEYFTEAINLSKDNADYILVSYLERAMSKFFLDDFRGCYLDCNTAIKMDGITPKVIDRLYLSDEIKEVKGTSYLFKGMSEQELGYIDDACIDWSKAGELGKKEAYKLITEYCNK